MTEDEKRAAEVAGHLIAAAELMLQMDSAHTEVEIVDKTTGEAVTAALYVYGVATIEEALSIVSGAIKEQGTSYGAVEITEDEVSFEGKELLV